MGAWDVGPFDNDTAADWRDDLEDAPPADQIRLVRDTLAEVAGHGAGYLDYDPAAAAIAAAALVAEGFEVPADIPPLALRALDRVVAGESEWRSLWEQSLDRALATLEPIRTALRAR